MVTNHANVSILAVNPFSLSLNKFDYLERDIDQTVKNKKRKNIDSFNLVSWDDGYYAEGHITLAISVS